RALTSSSVLAQASLARANYGCAPISHLEFAQDVCDMVAHCLGAQHEPSGDVRVLVALRDQVEDFSLAIAELREDLRHRRRLKAGEELHEPSCYGGAENGFPFTQRADSACHFRVRCAFQ